MKLNVDARLGDREVFDVDNVRVSDGKVDVKKPVSAEQLRAAARQADEEGGTVFLHVVVS